MNRALQKLWVKHEQARWQYGTLGRTNPDFSVTVDSGRIGFVWVTMSTGTIAEVYNQGAGAVDARAGLPVRIRDDNGRLVIDGQDTSAFLAGDTNAPSKVYSVNDIGPDSHGNVTLDTDDIAEGTTNFYYTAERARDDVGAALVEGAGIDITIDDAGNTITIASTVSQYTDEMARDALGTALTQGTGITITVNDAGDTITIATTITQYTDELAQDAVGGILTDSSTIDFTYNDGANTITASVIQAGLDHGSIGGLGDDDHGQYLLLAGRSGGQTITGIASTGSALAVIRNLGSASTNSPVMRVEQQSATDDQPAFVVRQKAGSIAAAQFIGENGNTFVYFDTYDDTAASRPVFFVRRSRGTEASPTNVSSGDEIGTFVFYLRSGGAFNEAGKIGFVSDGTPGSSDSPGRLEVYTTPDGTSTSALALLINSAQQAMFGGLTSVGASGKLATKAGTSSNDAAVGGVLYVDSGTHANGTTVETDLASYVGSVPANTLAVNNQELVFEAWGTFAANGNTKTLKVKFGASSWTVASGITAGGSWLVRGRIIRTGAATQDVVIEENDTTNAATGITISTAAETLSGAVTLKLTGQGGASNDVKQEYFKVWWEDANT